MVTTISDNALTSTQLLIEMAIGSQPDPVMDRPLKAQASSRKVGRLNLSKGACRKVARMLGESPNVWKQVEFFRSHRNFSSFPLGRQFFNQQSR